VSTSKIKIICLVYLSIYRVIVALIVKQLEKSKNPILIGQTNRTTNDQLRIKLNIIRLSGVPPLTGFFLKALVIYSLIKFGTSFKAGTLLLIAATGAFYGYNQTTIKIMIFKPQKRKGESPIRIKNQKKTIL